MIFHFRDRKGKETEETEAEMPGGRDLTGAVRRFYCFYGRVQGVGFRFTASAIAEKWGLTGWVCNRDEHVEMEVQGQPERIDQMIRELRDGQEWIWIERMTCEERPLQKREKKFQIAW